MAYDPTWDFRDPASKARVLGVLRAEVDKMFELAGRVLGRPLSCRGVRIASA
jgi:hypothetical protein